MARKKVKHSNKLLKSKEDEDAVWKGLIYGGNEVFLRFLWMSLGGRVEGKVLERVRGFSNVSVKFGRKGKGILSRAMK